jgi:HAMP domain-containing protein
LLEARLPASASDSEVAGFVRRLGWTVFLLSLGAVAAALLLARRIVRPLQSVAESATRLGRGDFSASIPSRAAAPRSLRSRARSQHASPPVELISCDGARPMRKRCCVVSSKKCMPSTRTAA